MAVPGFQDFMLPILRLAADHESLHKKQYDGEVARLLDLSEEDRTERVPSGQQTTFQNRITWAVSYMVKAQLLERPARATIKITDAGTRLLAENPARIDIPVLMRYPSFREFREGRTDPDPKPVIDGADDTADSPSDLMEKANKTMRRMLASELVDQMKLMAPSAFEQLVVDVLVSMGYGGTLSDAGQAIGRSGDGGIDGVIKEDRLGLDFIYVQAKRWENTILRPQLQGFAGALMARNSQKGVFITTSDFSSGARDFVRSIPTNIVLIDGQQLAELMIDYGVGVIDEQTYRVKRVDPEYFGE